MSEFKIPTVINPEYSVVKGLEIRKARDAYNTAYNEYLEQHPSQTGAGIGYDPYIGIQFHPEIQRQSKAHQYAMQQSGYNTQDPTQPYKDADQIFGVTSAVSTSMIPLFTASAGTFGAVPKLAADLKFAYDGYKGLTGPEG